MFGFCACTNIKYPDPKKVFNIFNFNLSSDVLVNYTIESGVETASHAGHCPINQVNVQ